MRPKFGFLNSRKEQKGNLKKEKDCRWIQAKSERQLDHCSDAEILRGGAYHFTLQSRWRFIEREQPSVVKDAQREAAWEKARE